MFSVHKISLAKRFTGQEGEEGKNVQTKVNSTDMIRVLTEATLLCFPRSQQQVRYSLMEGVAYLKWNTWLLCRAYTCNPGH